MLQLLRTRITDLPRGWKRVLLLAFDFSALSAALWSSFALRFDNWSLPDRLDQFLIVFSAPLIAFPIFVRLGLYRAVIRYLPERALWTTVKAMAMATVAWVLFVFVLSLVSRGFVPRSVPIIYWALGTVLIAGSRFAAKWLLWPADRSALPERPAVVIYGAGQSGTLLAQSLQSTHLICGFLDDKPSLHKREVAGIMVYPPSFLPNLVRDFGVKQVILGMPTVPVSRRKEIVAAVSLHGVKVQWLPGIHDLATGKYRVSQLREIEIDDLLGRSSVPPSLDLVREMVVDRSIMVTGAGGSIGSELCRKIMQWKPRRLVLFEANEHALYQIERALRSELEAPAIPVLGSVTDVELVRATLANNGIDVVFHAAAHKHVPLIEENVLEGIRNNVFGTRTVVEEAYRAGVSNFVLISTDKAVRPTNVMGATKRWAELIVLLKVRETQDRKFCAVRFGNVLGSNGSVVPLFKEQIAHGGPVTVTDFGMTRYFMSIKEAAELIVQAGALAGGGDVFLLDMGEPVAIVELAANMVRLAGLTIKGPDNPDGDIEIVNVGKRPGEKMFEELFYDETTARPTKHPKILKSSVASTADDRMRQLVLNGLEQLELAMRQRNETLARSILFDLVAQSDVRTQASDQL